MNQENKTALITGYTGQDGTFLTKLLLDKGYTVVGLVRRISTEPPRRVRGKFDFSDAIDSGRLILEDGDLQSMSSLNRILGSYMPQEIYNLAWQSHVGLSFKIPEVSLHDYEGYVNLITAVEAQPADYAKRVRIYQASTSEMYGDFYKEDDQISMMETTPLRPVSPYGIAKTAAHHYGQMKRGQGLFISNGILFNHESEIRGGDFVTQKIARGAVAWERGYESATVDKQPPVLELGNLNSGRDWGYAGDYVKLMHAMLQADAPDDFVIATGRTRTVREFVEAAFTALGRSIEWRGELEHEEGWVEGILAVRINPKFYRPNDVNYLNGASDKAYQTLGWAPETDFETMVKIMVEAAESDR